MEIKKLSDYISGEPKDIPLWVSNRDYAPDKTVLINNCLLKCVQAHTSSPSIVADIISSKWFPLTPYPLKHSERISITSPIEQMQITETDDIPFTYTYQNGNWMLQNYTASFIRNVSSAKQVPVVNTAIKLGITECILGSSISYNSTTGVFTLQGGAIYDFKGGVGSCYSNNAAGWLSTSWQKSTDGTNWENVGSAKLDLVNTNAWNHVPNLTDAGGIFEATQLTYLRYIPTSVNIVSQIGDNSILPQVGVNQYCWAEIKEVSRSTNFKVNLQTDADISMIQKTYGSVHRSTGSSPAQAVGTSPTNVLFTDDGENTGVTQTLNLGTPFTITKAGVYLIIGSAHSDTDGSTSADFNGQLAKNGVSISGSSRTWGDADHCVALNTTTYCNIGDTISLQAWGGISASLKGASLSIVQIA